MRTRAPHALASIAPILASRGRIVRALLLLVALALVAAAATAQQAQKRAQQPAARATAKTATTSASTGTAAAATAGANVLVCFERRTGTFRRNCTTVGWLSRALPERALEIAKKVNGSFALITGANGKPVQAACIGQDGVNVAVVLAAKAPTGSSPSTSDTCPSQQPSPFDDFAVDLDGTLADMTKTIDDVSAERAACAGGGKSVAAGDDKPKTDPPPEDAKKDKPKEEKKTAVVNSVSECPKNMHCVVNSKIPKGQPVIVDSSGGKPIKDSTKTLIGKAWRPVYDLFGGKEPVGTQGTIGVRGDCIDEMSCPSCEGRARTRAVAKQLRRDAYTGCNAEATPTPDGTTKTCYNVLQGKKLDKATLQKLLLEACKYRMMVGQPGPDGTMRCSLPPAALAQETNVCRDPQAMCAPDDPSSLSGTFPLPDELKNRIVKPPGVPGGIPSGRPGPGPSPAPAPAPRR